MNSAVMSAALVYYTVAVIESGFKALFLVALKQRNCHQTYADSIHYISEDEESSEDLKSEKLKSVCSLI